MNRRRCSQPNGFTLIELIITVVIVSILALIAYPTYVSTVRRANRADATTTLQSDSQTLERCYTQYFAYNSANCPAVSAASPSGYYTISLTATAAAYTLTATPTAGTSQANDTACTAFSITNTGAKCSTGTSGNNNCSADTAGGNCWSGH